MLRVDPGHPSSYTQLAQMVPPPLGRFVSAQLGHANVHHVLGLPFLTIDAVLQQPALSVVHDALWAALEAYPASHHCFDRLADMPRLIPPLTSAVLVVRSLLPAVLTVGHLSVETSFSLGGIGLVPPVAWGLPPLALA